MRAFFVTALLATLPAAAQYTEAPVSNGGNVKGRITYNGKPPAPKKITITKDRDLRRLSRRRHLRHRQGRRGEERGGYLSDIKSGKKIPADEKPVLDQKGCHYVPHVQAVPVHSVLQVKSSDPILHNVHSFLNGSTVINFAMPRSPGWS